MGELKQLRADNEQRLVALVREHPGSFSVETAAHRLVVTPPTVRSAVKRGVVIIRDHRLWPK
jgi:hypothetical protein